ncbi:hypothetical protein [Yinghuangia seranimata]|uniref:hypothetical protein n=1 Tax=Yinghuangia seranimata TaxID=408067 RepID=UPI00248AE51A|nr:hypothetical protein [Yinghuangia seranimata]MDI2127562.1 hypothetical protein [Yinghuangia seranimata]
MSIWLTLVKLDPAAADEARTRPESVAGLLDGTAGRHAEDYRALGDIAEGRAETEEGTADWTRAYPALAAATGTDRPLVEGSDNGYGPAFVLGPDDVRRVADGLAAEGWTGFLEIARFYVAAAAEGRAVLGALS